MKRGQGAFEYILLLAGVLLIVVLAIIILRGAVPGQQVGLANCKAQLAAVSVCMNSTGGWNSTIYGTPDACIIGGGTVSRCSYADYGVNPSCNGIWPGTGGASSAVNDTHFKCGARPA